MGGLKLLFICSIAASAYVVHSNAQSADNFKSITASLDKFALKLLAQTSDAVNPSLNLALSPYTVWSLMCIISEGALDNTAAELQSALGLPSSDDGKAQFRQMYRSLASNMLQNIDGVNFDISNAIFTTSQYNLNPNFEQVVESAYNVKVTPVDFTDKAAALKLINQQMAIATKNRITNFLNKGDLDDAEILMTSALFFKGQWKVPFNKTATFSDTFYDEQGNAQGEVDMMYQASTFPFSVIFDNKATAVELAYGKGDRMSMIVILPRKNQNLSTTLKRLANTPISTILDALAQAEQDYVDEDVQVFLPRFNINSDLTLNAVLDQLGIKDVFSLEKANLLGMFDDYLYLQRVIQKATIEVDEEGTTATSISGGSFAYKSPPPKFRANRPFIYLIVDKFTQAIVFLGRVTNPRTLCSTCTGK